MRAACPEGEREELAQPTNVRIAMFYFWVRRATCVHYRSRVQACAYPSDIHDARVFFCLARNAHGMHDVTLVHICASVCVIFCTSTQPQRWVLDRGIGVIYAC